MDYKRLNDYEILYMVKENSDDARDLMFEKYSPIIKKLANYYYSCNKNMGADYDDFFQEGLIAFNKAINLYDENRDILFYTFAPAVINRHLQTFARNLKVKKNEVLNYSLRAEDTLYNVEDFKQSFDKSSIENIFSKLVNSLDLKYSSVFELRFNGFSYKEIAILLDLPISTVQSRISKIKAILLKKLQNLI